MIPLRLAKMSPQQPDLAGFGRPPAATVFDGREDERDGGEEEATASNNEEAIVRSALASRLFGMVSKPPPLSSGSVDLSPLFFLCRYLRRES